MPSHNHLRHNFAPSSLCKPPPHHILVPYSTLATTTPPCRSISHTHPLLAPLLPPLPPLRYAPLFVTRLRTPPLAGNPLPWQGGATGWPRWGRRHWAGRHAERHGTAGEGRRGTACTVRCTAAHGRMTANGGRKKARARLAAGCSGGRGRMSGRSYAAPPFAEAMASLIFSSNSGGQSPPAQKDQTSSSAASSSGAAAIRRALASSLRLNA